MKKIFSNYKQLWSNVYSQNGEDGIIHKLLEELSINSGYLIEFGAHDGITNSNTFNIVKNDKKSNFYLIYIEADKKLFSELIENTKDWEKIICINKRVGFSKHEETLDFILDSNNLTNDIELLSIDVDSEDLRIWDAIKIQPKIVIIEINSNLKVGVKNLHNNKIPGNSFSSTLRIAKKKGYKLIDHTGNMIFIRKDLIKYTTLGYFYLLFPRFLFRYINVNKPFLFRWVEHNIVNKFFFSRKY